MLALHSGHGGARVAGEKGQKWTGGGTGHGAQVGDLAVGRWYKDLSFTTSITLVR